jgi:putative ABC transport system permease protein
MFLNYLKIVLRNLKKHKGYSLINVMGLTIGMTAFLFIMQYVMFELYYDDFHPKGENIYRVESQFFNGKELTDDWATSSYGYGPAMKQEFPEIVQYSRINLWNCERVVSYKDDIKFREKNVFLADSNFITMFAYPLVEGDAYKALTEPNSVVITESAALKYFGSEQPMGKILKFRNSDGEYVCQVTGVLKDIPANSHVQFDFLISWTSISTRWPGIDSFWYQHEAYTYVLLKPNADVASIEKKFFQLAEKYKTGAALKNLRWGIQLVPLTDIHLNAYKSYEREIKGNRTGVWALLVVAFVVLIIAWVNYFNLATARAVERAKEVGLRKVCGATRKQLMNQFLFESAIINTIALIFTLMITQISARGFIQLTTLSESSSFSLSNPLLWLLVFGLLISGVFFGGLYPAYLISMPAPAKILKGRYSHSSSGILLRKSLIVLQFTISIVLVSGTLLIYQQIRYMKTQELGANIDRTLVVKTPVAADWSEEKTKNFRNELLASPAVKNVTTSSSIPGKEVAMFMSNHRADDMNLENKLYEMLMTDYDFIDTYGLQILYGRNFSREFETDKDALILTEEAVELFGFKNDETVIGEKVVLEGSDKKYKIIGVVKNYHHQSLKLGFKPIILFMSPDHSWIVKNYFSVKVTGENLESTVKLVEKKWQEFFPSTSFDYFFLDEFFDAQYNADRQFGTVFLLFTGLAIFIACIGLFGLVSFTTKQKTKEIGIRKSVGASIKNIVFLLVKEFVKWVGAANVIALPIAWFVMENWLQDYAFRIDIKEHVWVFVLAGLLTFVITIATLSYLVIKAARANPVEALRYE